jgi:hypothetical protein
MYITALITTTKLWNQPKCLSTDEWIKKMWCLYNVEDYATIKKNGIMSLAKKWIELKVILSEISQTQKDSIAYSLSYAESRPKK